MGTQISLDHLPARSRFQHFRDIAASLYVPVSLTSEAPESFRFVSEGSDLGALSFVSGFMTRVKVVRSPQDVLRSESDNMMKLIVPLSGSIGVRQDRRETLVKPGQFFVDDPSRPYEEHIMEDLDYLAILLPRRSIIDRVGGLDDLTAIAFGGELPHNKLALDFILSLSAVRDELDVQAAGHLSSVALDLIVTALRERGNRVATGIQSYRSAQFQLTKAFINDHLQDPTLSFSLVAAALGASDRYVSDLLNEYGLSYRRYLLEQRLLRCAQDLADPRLNHRTVTTIAYSWGFSSGSHFSRAFRAVYNMSPRDYRAWKVFGINSSQPHA